jgi:hypothetical protein
MSQGKDQGKEVAPADVQRILAEMDIDQVRARTLTLARTLALTLTLALAPALALALARALALPLPLGLGLGPTLTPTLTLTLALALAINQDGVVTLAEFTSWYLRSEARMKYELDAAWAKIASNPAPTPNPNSTQRGL